MKDAPKNPHRAAIHILEMEIGRYRCMAASHAVSPSKREVYLREAAEAEKTMLWLKSRDAAALTA